MSSSTSVPSSREELSKLYISSQKGFEDLENSELNSTDEKYQDIVKTLIQNFVRCSTAADILSLISSNDELDDIDPKDLKYLLVPYYIGSLFAKLHVKPTVSATSSASPMQMQQQIRLKHIKQTMAQYKKFLQDCAKLGLLHQSDKEFFTREMDQEETVRRPANPMAQRTESAERYKRKKQATEEIAVLTAKIEQLSANFDETTDTSLLDVYEKKRSMSIIQQSALEAIESIKSFKSELELLEFATKNLNDRKVEEIRKQRTVTPQLGSTSGGTGGFQFIPVQQGGAPLLAQPIQLSNGSKVMKFYPPTATASAQQEQLIHSVLQQQGVLPQSQQASLQSRGTMQEKIRSEVFMQRNLPTKSLEEFAEEEHREAMERSKREKEAAEKNKKKHEDEETEEENAERMKKEAAWDDWKDNHPKGMGNMLR